MTTPRTDIMYRVTEYGLVNLKGLPVAQRARTPVGLAHLAFRQDLAREARSRDLIPKGFF